MDYRSRRLLLVLVLLAAVLPLSSSPSRAASPGTELLKATLNLYGGQTQGIPLHNVAGAVNLRIEVSGGTTPASDSVTTTLQDISTQTPSNVGSWAVRSGETAWGHATAPTKGRFEIRNTSSSPITYTLTLYTQGTPAKVAGGEGVWSGTARGNGITSAIQLNIPAAGLYSFTLGATSGSFQLDVDDGYLLKTVVKDRAPATTDSVYHLTAGVHTFKIRQLGSVGSTSWTMKLDPVGGVDTLPSAEATAELGGGTFTEEWIPINVAAATPVNIRIEATGSATTSLTAQLYNGAAPAAVFESTKVLGGETAWGSSQLTAGLNRLRIVAGSTSEKVGYTITVSAVSQTPLTWNGKTYNDTNRADAGHASIQVSVPQAGLYSFKLAASSGRFQFALGDRFLQKTVTDTLSADFSAFVPAGTHRLTIAQDAVAAVTTWGVEIAPTANSTDVLPFKRTGGTLQKPAPHAFSDEWLPLHVGSQQPANVNLVVNGAATDKLTFELCNGSGAECRAHTVFGGETFWLKDALASGTNLLHLAAAATNTGRVDYVVEVRAVDAVPGTWRGTSRDAGPSSTLYVYAPSNGVYNLSLTLDEGAGQLLIDNDLPVAPASTADVGAQGSVITQRVELKRGLHTLTLQQDSSTPNKLTTWQISASLLENTQQFIYIPMIRR